MQSLRPVAGCDFIKYDFTDNLVDDALQCHRIFGHCDVLKIYAYTLRNKHQALWQLSSIHSSIYPWILSILKCSQATISNAEWFSLAALLQIVAHIWIAIKLLHLLHEYTKLQPSCALVLHMWADQAHCLWLLSFSLWTLASILSCDDLICKSNLYWQKHFPAGHSIEARPLHSQTL